MKENMFAMGRDLSAEEGNTKGNFQRRKFLKTVAVTGGPQAQLEKSFSMS